MKRWCHFTSASNPEPFVQETVTWAGKGVVLMLQEHMASQSSPDGLPVGSAGNAPLAEAGRVSSREGLQPGAGGGAAVVRSGSESRAS